MRILLTAYAVMRPLERARCRTTATDFRLGTFRRRSHHLSAGTDHAQLVRLHGLLAAAARFVLPRDGRGCVACQRLTRVRDGLTRRTDKHDRVRRFDPALPRRVSALHLSSLDARILLSIFGSPLAPIPSPRPVDRGTSGSMSAQSRVRLSGQYGDPVSS
jgi:hypothetical protein